MIKSTGFGALGLALVLAGASGCSSQKTAIYEHENFDDSGTFSRSFPVSDAQSCEAARRALLSQGYIITSTDPKLVSGNKSFQQTGDSHLQISFNIVCAADSGQKHRSTIFANALQDRYALKKVNNSASLGVGVLGSVSMPIGSTDDSMVKVASETVTASKFYERYFALVESFLPAPAKKAAKTPAEPKSELGVPEPAPASVVAPLAPEATTPPAPAPAPAEPAQAAPPQAPAEAQGTMSQPLAPPTEAAPISVEPSPVPTAEQGVPAESAQPPAAPATEAPL
ncbi:hypothetical protein D3C80_879370 [compost metagenome]